MGLPRQSWVFLMESCWAAPQLNCDRDGAVDQSFYGIISNMTTWLDAFGSVLGIVVAFVLLPVGTWSVYDVPGWSADMGAMSRHRTGTHSRGRMREETTER